MYFHKRQKQAGIGLLELMLAMAIIAILIVMSITYFQSSKNSTLNNAGVQQMQSMLGVLSGLSDPGASAGGADGGSLTNTVMLSGSVPKAYIIKVDNVDTLSSPWGGSSSYAISYKQSWGGNDNNKGKPYAEIIGSNLPNYACVNLASQFPAKKNNVLASKCETSDKGNTGTLTIDYAFSNRQPIIVNSTTNTNPSS